MNKHKDHIWFWAIAGVAYVMLIALFMNGSTDFSRTMTLILGAPIGIIFLVSIIVGLRAGFRDRRHH